MAWLVVGAAIVAVVFLATLRKKNKLEIPSLQGKHLFITGGSSGIGLAIAKQALGEGAFVTLNARSELKLNKAVETLVHETGCDKERINVSVADVGDQTAISTAVKDSFSWKPIDVLVCNAGYTKAGYFDQVPAEDHYGQVQTNLMGVIYTVHSALPLMKTRSSASNKLSVVIVSSGAGLFLLYGSSVYTATKHALRGLAECLYFELLPYNINVNLICPGFVETPLLEDVDTGGEFDELLKVLNLYDPKRIQSPQKVAEYTLTGVKRGTFLVTTKPTFFPLVVLTRGMIASGSFSWTLLEAFWAPIIRVLTFFTTKSAKQQIVAHHLKNQARLG